jgi:hypothetical protein
VQTIRRKSSGDGAGVGAGHLGAVDRRGVGDVVAARSVAFPVTGYAPLLDRD